MIVVHVEYINYLVTSAVSPRYLQSIPLTNGVGTTTNTMPAPSVAAATSVVVTIRSLSGTPGRYGVFS